MYLEAIMDLQTSLKRSIDLAACDAELILRRSIQPQELADEEKSNAIEKEIFEACEMNDNERICALEEKLKPYVDESIDRAFDRLMLAFLNKTHDEQKKLLDPIAHKMEEIDTECNKLLKEVDEAFKTQNGEQIAAVQKKVEALKEKL